MEKKRNTTQAKTYNQEKFEKVQEIYEEYYFSNDERLFIQLVELTDSIYASLVRRLLKQNKCYDEDSKHTVKQEVHLAIWKKICKSREDGKLDVEFSRYCKGIYHHKAIDVVRSRKSIVDKDKGELIFLDAILPDGNRSYADIVEDKRFDLERTAYIEDINKVFEQLFLLYCRTLVSSNTEPQRKLAIFYARILPHVLHINHEIKTIAEGKMASAKWAFDYMKDKTIKVLGEESEIEMKKFISPTLSWGEEFWTQLEIPVAAGQVSLKDVIYTKEYDKRKIDYWSENFHKSLVQEIHEIVIKDPKLVESVMKYVPENDKIYRLVKGGK
ncbi:MAG: hypothetical protein Q4D90_00255 [bacterium]|nr:hypothetical protein [bacterium]